MIDAGNPDPDRADLTTNERARTSDEAALANKLIPLLRDADRRGFTLAAIHIDAAIIHLGGLGTPPCEP